MKLLLKVLSEEFVLSIIQIVLTVTLYDARDLPVGVAHYLETVVHIPTDFFAIVAIVAAIWVCYRLYRTNEFLAPLEFIATSTPLIIYLGATTGYVISQHLSWSSIAIIGLFYLYFLSHVIVRAAHSGRR